MIKETRSFYKIKLLVENVVKPRLSELVVNFNSISMHRSEDDSTITFTDRMTIFEVQDVSADSFSVDLYIENEGEEIEERIDYLLDEDYLIKGLDAKIIDDSNSNEFEFKIDGLGTQLTKDVPIKVPKEHKELLNKLEFYSNNDNVLGAVYDIVKMDNGIIKTLESIYSIPTL